MTSTYAYPANSNQLTSITTTSGSAGPAMTFQYDTESRLAKAFQTAAPAEGGIYAYDAMSRLASRIVTHATAPTSTTTLYAYDTSDHIIAELNTSGQTLREYIWLNDMPFLLGTVSLAQGLVAVAATGIVLHKTEYGLSN